MLPSECILPCPIPLNVVILLVFISFVLKCNIFISEMSAPVSISSVIGVLVLFISNWMQKHKLRFKLYTFLFIELILGEVLGFPNQLFRLIQLLLHNVCFYGYYSIFAYSLCCHYPYCCYYYNCYS